jgi:hypothetical protein
VASESQSWGRPDPAQVLQAGSRRPTGRSSAKPQPTIRGCPTARGATARYRRFRRHPPQRARAHLPSCRATRSGGDRSPVSGYGAGSPASPTSGRASICLIRHRARGSFPVEAAKVDPQFDRHFLLAEMEEEEAARSHLEVAAFAIDVFRTDDALAIFRGRPPTRPMSHRLSPCCPRTMSTQQQLDQTFSRRGRALPPMCASIRGRSRGIATGRNGRRATRRLRSRGSPAACRRASCAM